MWTAENKKYEISNLELSSTATFSKCKRREKEAKDGIASLLIALLRKPNEEAIKMKIHV